MEPIVNGVPTLKRNVIFHCILSPVESVGQGPSTEAAKHMQLQHWRFHTTTTEREWLDYMYHEHVSLWYIRL